MKLLLPIALLLPVLAGAVPSPDTASEEGDKWGTTCDENDCVKPFEVCGTLSSSSQQKCHADLCRGVMWGGRCRSCEFCKGQFPGPSEATTEQQVDVALDAREQVPPTDAVIENILGPEPEVALPTLESRDTAEVLEYKPPGCDPNSSQDCSECANVWRVYQERCHTAETPAWVEMCMKFLCESWMLPRIGPAQCRKDCYCEQTGKWKKMDCNTLHPKIPPNERGSAMAMAQILGIESAVFDASLST